MRFLRKSLKLLSLIFAHTHIHTRKHTNTCTHKCNYCADGWQRPEADNSPMLSATDTGACDLRYRGSVVGLHKRRDITGIGLSRAHKRARMLWNTMLQQRTWRRYLTWWAKTTLRQRSTPCAAAAQARRGRANCKLQHARYKKQQHKIVMQTTPRAQNSP